MKYRTNSRLQSTLRHWFHTALYPGTLVTAALIGYGLFRLLSSRESRIPPGPLQFLLGMAALYGLILLVLRSLLFCRPLGRLSFFYGKRLVFDRDFRTRLALYWLFGVNTLYALLKLVMGWIYHSSWQYAMAFYYGTLSAMRLFLVYNVRLRHSLDYTRQLQVYRRTGWLLLVLMLAVSGMMVQRLFFSVRYSYPASLLLASGAFAAFSVFLALRNLLYYRGMSKPLLSAAKMLSLAAAGMSVYSFGSSLLACLDPDKLYGRAEKSLALMLDALILLMAWYMIRRSNALLKKTPATTEDLEDDFPL